MTRARLALALLAGLPVASAARACRRLPPAKSCIAGYGVYKKLVGLSYKDVAVKSASQEDALDKLSAKVIKGGAGVWGPVPMPANSQVSPDEAKKLVAWILTQK